MCRSNSLRIQPHDAFEFMSFHIEFLFEIVELEFPWDLTFYQS